MAQRHKPKVESYQSIEEVDEGLREIGLIERSLEAIDAKAQKKIGDIKAEAVLAGEDLRKRLIEISSDIGFFAKENKAELFKDNKSIELSHGKIGYRKSTKIAVKKTTLDLLSRFGMSSYIRVKSEVDKEAMAELADEDLARVDAARKITDDFFCEAKRVEPNIENLKTQVAKV